MLLIDPKSLSEASEKAALQVLNGLKDDGWIMALDELENGPDVVARTIRNIFERAVLGVTYERRGNGLVRTAV